MRSASILIDTETNTAETGGLYLCFVGVLFLCGEQVSIGVGWGITEQGSSPIVWSLKGL